MAASLGTFGMVSVDGEDGDVGGDVGGVVTGGAGFGVFVGGALKWIGLAESEDFSTYTPSMPSPMSNNKRGQKKF